MNVENFLKVADAIEHHSIPDLGFNMAAFQIPREGFEDLSGHNCGTLACIGGWANALQAENLQAADHLGERDARAFLGIGPQMANELFFASNFPEELQGPPEHDYFLSITAQKAVAVLRHLAATGEVDWTVEPSTLSAAQTDGAMK